MEIVVVTLKLNDIEIRESIPEGDNSQIHPTETHN